MDTYTLKPPVFEAFQYTGHNMQELSELCCERGVYMTVEYCAREPEPTVKVRVSSGERYFNPGYWLVFNTSGSIPSSEIMSPNEFKERFQKVEKPKPELTHRLVSVEYDSRTDSLKYTCSCTMIASGVLQVSQALQYAMDQHIQEGNNGS